MYPLDAELKPGVSASIAASVPTAPAPRGHSTGWIQPMTERTSQRIDELERRLEDVESENRAIKEAMEEQSSGTSFTRRTALGALGGAALLGGASQPVAAESSPWKETDGDGDYLLETESTYDGIEVHQLRSGTVNDTHVVGSKSFQWKSIQDAHDALPDTGGKILVTDSYDFSNEDTSTDPVIDISKPVTLTGQNRSSTVIDASGYNKNVIRLREDAVNTNETYKKPRTIERLKIKGGNDAIQIKADTSCVVRDVIIWKPGRHGVLVDKVKKDFDGDGTKEEKASFNTLFEKVQIQLAGKDGIHAPDQSKSHGIFVLNCYLLDNNRHAIRAGNANSLTLMRSGIQHSGDSGVVWNVEFTMTIRDCYFEKNAEDVSDGAAIEIENYGDGALIEGNYFQGLGKTENAIQLYTKGSDTSRNVEGLHIRNNGYWNYTDGFLYLDNDNIVDMDVHKMSNVALKGDDTPFWDPASADGTRTRSDGVIVTQNLSGVEGQFVGDLGIDDGSNTEYGSPDLCLWRGSDWRQVGTGNTFS